MLNYKISRYFEIRLFLRLIHSFAILIYDGRSLLELLRDILQSSLTNFIPNNRIAYHEVTIEERFLLVSL